MSRFCDFFIQAKKKMHHSIYPVKFGKYVKFHLACVAGGIREDISIFATLNSRWNKGYCIVLYIRHTRLFTNPLTASPLVFTASLPKQKHPASYAG